MSVGALCLGLVPVVIQGCTAVNTNPISTVHVTKLLISAAEKLHHATTYSLRKNQRKAALTWTMTRAHSMSSDAVLLVYGIGIYILNVKMLSWSYDLQPSTVGILLLVG